MSKGEQEMSDIPRPISRRMALAALVGPAMVACLPGQDDRKPAATTAPEKATISYAQWDTPGSAERTQARIDDFQKRYPGTKVEMLSWPYQQYLDTLQVMYASDSGPDTVNLDMPIVQQYAKLGVF